MGMSSITGQHILLTALGREQRKTVYELHGSTVEEPLAPLALLRLLPQDARPNRVLALCTVWRFGRLAQNQSTPALPVSESATRSSLTVVDFRKNEALSPPGVVPRKWCRFHELMKCA